MEALILFLVLLAGLAMIPLGLPGTWVQVAAIAGYSFLVPGQIGTPTIVITGIFAVIGEVLEFTLAGRYARKYGGSRRAGWGAILGGIVGAFMGVPIPIIGSVVGAFAGSFVGALVFEYTAANNAGAATRVAWGALVGRVATVAVKVGLGCAIIAWTAIALLF